METGYTAHWNLNLDLGLWFGNISSFEDRLKQESSKNNFSLFSGL